MRKSVLKTIILTGLIFSRVFYANAQGYLHQHEKSIVDANGNNFLFRSIGTGNWMIQEGYMMKSTDAGINTQWQFREKLINTIGEAKTDSFYNVWLRNNLTRADIDSMKSWGFNAIRPALHYKLFTPPIEDEPVAGQITWIDKGFVMVDSLIKWCSDNQMYVILDMHGTPGGQGKNMDICDYDPSKPALWEKQANKDKLVALWKKLADRYKNEPWVGGYDLINETNWTFTEAGNKPLWDMHRAITAAIREVDTNHMIILEGNGFANDYNGLPTLWDDNMVLSFHKYWTYNDESSLDWMIKLRNERIVPLWLGESGENSNPWFTQLISLAERNNIGWSWWPVKKGDINNVMEVKVNTDYTNLMKNWETGSPAMTADQAFEAVLTFAENHKIENCIFHTDVVDAMIRQPFSNEALPFKKHTLGEPIYFANYDLGRNNVAYTDTDTANYHGSTGNYTSWNAGWTYRNDGVDIQKCTDATSNGYNVGWTETNEWLQYSLKSDSLAAYLLEIRYASESTGSKFHVEVNNAAITPILSLPATGNWQTWQTTSFNNVVIPKGDIKIKVVFDQGGSNLNYFKLTNPSSTDAVDFVCISAETATDASDIYIDLNMQTTTPDSEIQVSDFALTVDNESVNIISVTKIPESSALLVKTDVALFFDNEISVSYSGISIKAGAKTLAPFNNIKVKNNYAVRHLIPGKIQAENYAVNNGLVFESCTDAGGGQNSGYAAAGDYLDYNVRVTTNGIYTFNYRVATTATNAQLVLLANPSGDFNAIDTIQFTSTGGWQTWKTQSSEVRLTEGYYTLRLLIKQGEQNLNWFEPVLLTSANEPLSKKKITLSPNPAHNFVQVTCNFDSNENTTVSLYNATGKAIDTFVFENSIIINTLAYPKGLYFIQIKNETETQVQKLIIQ